MTATLAYEPLETLYQGAVATIQRARQCASGQTVILKRLNQLDPAPEPLARLRREYEMLRSLSLPGVVRACDLLVDQGRWTLVLEDCGGEVLANTLAHAPFALVDFWEVAIALAACIDQLHQQGVIHKAINPTNIVRNAQTGQIKLIDFGLATRLAQENQLPRHPNRLEGTLAYLSPEQTGRMNRSLDYRTDLYSLGVTLYELLTGQLPFPNGDRLTLVHAHLAKQPVSPTVLNPTIPPPLAQIILRLLAKTPEDRYQSALGLQRDLEHCRQQWQATGQVAPFPLARQDVAPHFQVAQRLYGRAYEIEQLLAALQRVRQGACEVVMVTGYTGIGKSSLIQAIVLPILSQGGWLITGKFEQLQREIPYASLIQAFRHLVQQLLTASEAAIDQWRRQLQQSLTPNGQVLIDVIPEIELILGPQPAAPVLPPAEAQRRFYLVMQTLIDVFAQPAQPLVLFLDDLQWADGASLQLIQHLFSLPNRSHCLLIGAYRSNEVGDGHLLQVTLQSLRQVGCRLQTLELAPLGLSVVQQLLVDTLHASLAASAPLAQLVLQKTEGNPFFIHEFLHTLYSENLLCFDPHVAGWRWEMPQIRARAIPDTLVAWMTQKLQKLAAETQTVLTQAACIGTQFDLPTLAFLLQATPAAITRQLAPALAAGLITPLTDDFPLSDSPPLPDGSSLLDEGLLDEAGQGESARLTATYHFAHDQIQQAAYELSDKHTRQQVHQRLGQYWLHTMPPAQRPQQIFTIVNQLNLGMPLITQPAARQELAELNLLAGQHAKASGAYQPACYYLETGLQLLAADRWQRQYPLSLTLHLETAEAAFLNADYGRMEQVIALVLQAAHNLLDKVKAYEIQILAAVARNQLHVALATALPVLAELGVHFPTKPSNWHLLRALLATKWALRGKAPADLLDLPLMHDAKTLAIMRLLHKIYSVCYLSAPLLFPLVVMKQVVLSLKHGNAAESSKAYAYYGVILYTVNQNIAASAPFAQLALQLVERVNDNLARGQVYMSNYFFLQPWNAHLRTTLQPLLTGHQIALSNGDTEYAGYLIGAHTVYTYYVGEMLESADAISFTALATIAQLQQERSLFVPRIYRQIVLNLLGRSQDPARLHGESYDDEQMPPLHQEAKDITGHLYLSKLFLAYLFGQYRLALVYADRTEQCLSGFQGVIFGSIFHFYAALARLALFAPASKAEQKAIRQQVRAHLKHLKARAQAAPMNFLHKAYLVEAEYARVLGKDEAAHAAYTQAIRLAHEHGYSNEEALAQELAARFAESRGDSELAHQHLRHAYDAYQRWGASAKAAALTQAYPHLWRADNLVARQKTATTTETAQLQALDIESVLKATQTISGEIALDKLLNKLMKIVVENAGAQHGFLLFEDNGQWRIETESDIETGEPVLPSGDNAPSFHPISHRLAATVINYVARTHESVVLDNARQTGLFTQDSYIVRSGAKSIICTPLLNQGKLTGILYLENNLAPGVFTPERLRLLQILSTQAAIAVENARLYAQLAEYNRTLEHQVAARTADLAQAVQATEREKRYFEALLVNSPVAIVTIDPTQQIVSWNPSAETLFGYTESEVIGRNIDDLIAQTETLQQEARAQTQTLPQTQETVRLIAQRQRKDGALVDVEGMAVPILAEGAQASHFLIYHDITELQEGRRRLEQRSEEIRQLNRQLDAENRRMGVELAVARHLQQLLQPQPTELQQATTLDIASYMQPADEVGGDYYDILHHPGGVKISIGDVTDHGLTSGVIMLMTQTAVRTLLTSGETDPVRFLDVLNRTIYGNLQRMQASHTLSLTLLDYQPNLDSTGQNQTGQVRLSGQHEEVLLVRSNGVVERIDTFALGFPIGLLEDASTFFNATTFDLAPGDGLVLYTDGIPEAENEAGELYGIDRLCEMVGQHWAEPAEAIKQQVIADVIGHIGGQKIYDDLTLLVIKQKGVLL